MHVNFNIYYFQFQRSHLLFVEHLDGNDLLGRFMDGSVDLCVGTLTDFLF